MTVRTFFGGFSLNMANITICDTNHDLLLSGTVHFTDEDDYRFQDLDGLGDRLIESWFVNLRGELFITVYSDDDYEKEC